MSSAGISHRIIEREKKDRTKQLRRGEDENYLSCSTNKKNVCGIIALNILIMMELAMQVKVAMKMVFAK